MLDTVLNKAGAEAGTAVGGPIEGLLVAFFELALSPWGIGLLAVLGIVMWLRR